MAEEFLWDINWDELPDESASQPTAPGPPKARIAPIQTPTPNLPPPQSPPKPPPLPRAIPVEAPSASSAPASPAVAAVEKKVLIRGPRIDLATLGRGDLVLDVAVKLTASGANLCCLGLLKNDRFAGDAYFVFPSQTATPCGSCRLVANGREVDLRLDLTRAPDRERKRERPRQLCPCRRSTPSSSTARRRALTARRKPPAPAATAERSFAATPEVRRRLPALADKTCSNGAPPTSSRIPSTSGSRFPKPEPRHSKASNHPLRHSYFFKT